jgi:hypothetical protein
MREIIVKCSARSLGIMALLLPGMALVQEETVTPALQHIDLTYHWAGYFSLAVMVIAYIGC